MSWRRTKHQAERYWRGEALDNVGLARAVVVEMKRNEEIKDIREGKTDRTF